MNEWQGIQSKHTSYKNIPKSWVRPQIPMNFLPELILQAGEKQTIQYQ